MILPPVSTPSRASTIARRTAMIASKPHLTSQSRTRATNREPRPASSSETSICSGVSIRRSSDHCIGGSPREHYADYMSRSRGCGEQRSCGRQWVLLASLLDEPGVVQSFAVTRVSEREVVEELSSKHEQ